MFVSWYSKLLKPAAPQSVNGWINKWAFSSFYLNIVMLCVFSVLFVSIIWIGNKQQAKKSQLSVIYWNLTHASQYKNKEKYTIISERHRFPTCPSLFLYLCYKLCINKFLVLLDNKEKKYYTNYLHICKSPSQKVDSCDRVLYVSMLLVLLLLLRIQICFCRLWLNVHRDMSKVCFKPGSSYWKEEFCCVGIRAWNIRRPTFHRWPQGSGQLDLTFSL